METERLNEMFGQVTGKKGDLWQLDEGLRQKARVLVSEYTDQIGYIELEHVVFVRAIGVSSIKWLGKCAYVGNTPTCIIPRHVMLVLVRHGMFDPEELRGIEKEVLDIRYVIALNETAILSAAGPDPGNREFVETVTLYHELSHIKPEMDGNLPHNIQDFSHVLDRFGVHWTQGERPEDPPRLERREPASAEPPWGMPGPAEGPEEAQ